MKNLIAKIRQPRVLRILISVFIIIAIIGGFIFYEMFANRVSIEDSLIQAPIVSISPDVSGKIMVIDVHPGEKVTKGQALAVVGTSTLTAYEDGLIVSTDNEIGSIATAQTPVVQMINLSDVQVAGTIDENKGLNQIRVGQAVSFTVDALPGRSFWGYIDEISPTAKSTALQFTVSSSRPTQQFMVYANFDAYKYPQILNGMSAKMTVYTKTP